MRFKNLGKWVWIYNEHTDQFRAAKKDNYKELSNNNDSPLVLRSNSITTLIDIIERTDGDKDKIEKLIK